MSKENSHAQFDLTKNNDKINKLSHSTHSLVGVIILTFLSQITFGGITILLPLFFYYHLDINRKWLSILLIIIMEFLHTTGKLLTSGYFGHKCDFESSRKWMVWGAASAGICFIGYGICALNWSSIIGCTTLFLVLVPLGIGIFHFLYGITHSCVINASYTYLCRLTKRRGMFTFTTNGGRAIGVGLTGMVYVCFVGISDLEIGWTPINEINLFFVYIFLAVLMITSVVIVIRMLKKDQPMKETYNYNFTTHLKKTCRLLKNKKRRRVILPILSMRSLIGLLSYWGFLILAINTRPDTAGFSVVFIALIMGAPMVLWGYVSDKIGRKLTTIIGFVGTLGLVFFLFYPFVTNLVTIENLSEFLNITWIIIPLVACIILSSAYYSSFDNTLGNSTSLKSRSILHGSTMSVQQIMLSVSNFIGIFVGGLTLLILFFLTNFTLRVQLIALIAPSLFFLFITTTLLIISQEEGSFFESISIRKG